VTVHLVRGGDPVLLTDGVITLVHELAGDEDRALVVDDITDEDYEVARIIDAARTPPFLTARRVVVARHIEQFTRQDDVAPLIDYITDPLDTTALVLVAAGPVHKTLVDAVKKHGGELVDTDPGRATKDWLKEQFNDAPVKLDQAARDLVAERLGEAIGRLPALLDGLESTYGPGARLGEDEVEPFLGDAGGVPPWELTDAIDRGDTAVALDRLTRMVGGGERHPLQILATLSGHYGRVLRLSGSDATDEKSAAALLNLKGSTFPARKALDQARRLGPHGVARAYELLAGADLDMRGRVEWPDALLLEVLVARLSRLGGGAATKRPVRPARRPASS
jgi:DNA polymerase-3 subunit delta